MKLAKTLLGTAFAIPSVVVPLTTLSSCGQNWGVLTPFTIGSSEKGINDPYAGFIESNYYDFDGHDMVGYLQSNYTVDQKNSTAYAYSQPMKFVDDEKKKQEEVDQWQPASSGWYQSGDADFVTTAVDKYEEGGEQKSQNVTNARNVALSYNVTLVSSIASTINSYITNALSYQSSQISVKDIDKETNLKTAWGSQSSKQFALNHGIKGSGTNEQNNKFYEYNFALANANAGGTTKAMLRSSFVNYTFDKMPFPSYDFANDTRTNFSNDFFELLEGDDATAITEDSQYYTKTEKSPDSEEDKYTVYFYDSVPIKVNFKSLSQTYLDPSNKNGSFLVSDYYSSKDDAVKAVGNSWKENLPKFTNRSEEDSIPHYKNYTFDGMTTKAIHLSGDYDERLTDVKGNDFIALLSYQVKVYDNDHSKDTASLTGIQNIFPSYFLDLFNDGNKLFKQCRDDGGYIVNQEEINKLTVLFRQLFERTAGQGLLPIEKINDTSKNLLAFLGYMFCYDGSSAIDTSSFITTTEF